MTLWLKSFTTPAINLIQPLHLKKMIIITENDILIVCRLGGFHNLRSFLGSIGNLMDGNELFAEVYLGNSDADLLPDKAFAT